ncbi:MAG: phosphatidylcholine/phosphatidylserine synthase [Saprospiraceae bacterium]
MFGLLRVVPHLLTLTNLAAGCVACIALVRGDFDLVPWCLFISAVADFLDGFAARAAGVSGPFGRELDSLADMVSFGVSPGLMAFAMLGGATSGPIPLLAYAGLLIPLLSAVRLARFNIDQADTKHFIGLATPANTVFWFGLFMTWHSDALGIRQNLSQPELILPLVALFSWLMVSSITFFSNKINPKSRHNWPVGIVFLSVIVFPPFMGWAALPATMLLYVLSGLVWKPAP